MAELRSKAPKPITMYMIESEVFGLRTKEHGAELLETHISTLALDVRTAADKEARDLAAVQLAAMCVRVIEEVK